MRWRVRMSMATARGKEWEKREIEQKSWNEHRLTAVERDARPEKRAKHPNPVCS